MIYRKIGRAKDLQLKVLFIDGQEKLLFRWSQLHLSGQTDMIYVI